MHLVPFHAGHLAELRPQDAQAVAVAALTVAQARAFEGPHAVTLMDGAAPMVCAGATELWPHRAHVWSILSERVGAGNFAEVQRHARRYLAGLPFRRIEAAADAAWPAAARWLRSLGFVLETPRPARAYFENGADAWLFAMVRERA